MNEKVASIIKTQIETLPFVDKIAGLVRPLRMEVKTGDTKAMKTYPVATDISSEQCISGHYKDLIPDAKYRSIIYFEDNGCTLTYRNGRWVGFESRLLLVGWLNMAKLFNCQTQTGSAQVILSILSQFPEFTISDDVYREFKIIAVSEQPKTNAIFGKYSYDEIKNQYLMYPYDYFALNIASTFKINLDCITEFQIDQCTKC